MKLYLIDTSALADTDYVSILPGASNYINIVDYPYMILYKIHLKYCVTFVTEDWMKTFPIYSSAIVLDKIDHRRLLGKVFHEIIFNK